jgi:outer membrane protein OmpA-like peptidoglycan-associated protein
MVISALRLFIASLLLIALPVSAITYQPSMNYAEWRLELSPFACRMWQPIPYYGDAVFHYRAGEEQQFFLKPNKPAMRKGKAALKVNAPVWDDSRTKVDLGYVPVKGGEQPVKLSGKLATKLLSELYGGMSPELTRQSWYADDVRVTVALSSVNFRKAFNQYQDCLVNLLPVNFDQIARSRIHFKTGKWELTGASRERLDQVVLYVKADPSVTSFFIDGHTDTVGKRLANLELSKKRAETVTAYLAKHGIDENLITTRYHGEAYPLASNKTAAGRKQNRRVTLRLGRDGV